MIAIRKLQYIGKQYIVNVPVDFVSANNMQKGDYLAIDRLSDNVMQITKIADSKALRPNVKLEALQREASLINTLLASVGSELSSGQYAINTLRLSHIHSQIRKLQKRMKT